MEAHAPPPTAPCSPATPEATEPTAPSHLWCVCGVFVWASGKPLFSSPWGLVILLIAQGDICTGWTQNARLAVHQKVVALEGPHLAYRRGS